MKPDETPTIREWVLAPIILFALIFVVPAVAEAVASL